MEFLGNRSVRIAYHSEGEQDAKAVLLVHGFASNSEANWVRAGWIAPLLEAGFRVVTVDLRGHGHSDRSRDPGFYRVENFLDDLNAVLNELAIDRVGYIGYSFGSRIGWEFAWKYPSRVAKLVLGGMPLRDPFDDFDVPAALHALASGAPVGHEPTGRYLSMMSALPSNDPRALVSLIAGARVTRFDAVAHHPEQRTLLVAGDQDTIAAGAEVLAGSLANVSFMALLGRSHTNAITARAFKTAAIEFLADHASG